MAEDRREQTARRRRLLAVAGGYLVALGLIAFWPSRVSAPFNDELHWLERWIPGSFATLEFSANTALFIPVGLLLGLLLPRTLWWAVGLAGLGASFGIEFGQALLLPARVASLSDIIANTAGAVLGLVIVALSPGLRRRSPAARQPEPG